MNSLSIKVTREGHRTTVKSVAYAVDEQLNTSNSDFNLNENEQALSQHVSKLRQQKESLCVRLEALDLKVLDEEIIYSVKKRTLKIKSAKHVLLMN